MGRFAFKYSVIFSSDFAYVQIKGRLSSLMPWVLDVKARLSWHQNYSLQKSDVCGLSSYQNLYDWLYFNYSKIYVFLDTILHVSMSAFLFSLALFLLQSITHTLRRQQKRLLRLTETHQSSSGIVLALIVC